MELREMVGSKDEAAAFYTLLILDIALLQGRVSVSDVWKGMLRKFKLTAADLPLKRIQDICHTFAERNIVELGFGKPDAIRYTLVGRVFKADCIRLYQDRLEPLGDAVYRQSPQSWLFPELEPSVS